MFIDRIYRINHTETWNFNAPTLVTPVSHKITAKCGILCPKTLLLTEKQLHAIHFFVASGNVCPLAIPESCAQNMGIRLLENHSLISFARFTRRTQARGEPKLWLIYKVVPTKQPLRCEANYQRRIYSSTASCSQELSLQRQLQIKFNLSMRQTILWSTIYPVLTQAIF